MIEVKSYMNFKVPTINSAIIRHTTYVLLKITHYAKSYEGEMEKWVPSTILRNIISDTKKER